MLDLQAVGPMELEAAVRGYAAEVVGGGRDDAVTEVRRFDAGERHAVFRVGFNGAVEDVVVRIATDPEARDCARAEREARLLQRLAGVAAPRLLDFRCESRWFAGPSTCVEHVAGEQRELAECRGGDLEALGAIVKEVHAHTIDDDTIGTAADYLGAHLALLAGKLSTVQQRLPAKAWRRIDRAWSTVTERAEAMQRDPGFGAGVELVLLHGDISGGNVLWGPRPVLIDWEYARLGDPADEIAYAFGQNWLTADQRAAFWRGYGGDAALTGRVAWWEPITLLGSALWWAERWDRSRDHRDNAIRRLDAADALLA